MFNSQEQDNNPVELTAEERKAKIEAEELEESFRVRNSDNTCLYKTNQKELDECFFSIIALSKWTKTFIVDDSLKLTYSSISNKLKVELLSRVQSWSEVAKPAPNLFQEELTRYNLAYYLSFIEVGGETINLRDKDVEDRLKFLQMYDENALLLYGNYQFVFSEIIRRALLSKATLKNC